MSCLCFPACQLYRLPGFHEPFSALSHLLGALVFLILGCLLLHRGRGDGKRLLLLAIYSGSGIVLLATSGVYHMLPPGGAAHRVLARLDHCAIFALIAGTFTPVHGLLFRGWRRWGPLVVIWSAAAVGVALKALYFDRLPDAFSLALYLAMGWFGLVTACLVARCHGFRFIVPLLSGGVAYSAGGLADFCNWRVVVPGVIHPHDVFHLAVLAGATLHWVFIWQFAAGRHRPDERDNPSDRSRSG